MKTHILSLVVPLPTGISLTCWLPVPRAAARFYQRGGGSGFAGTSGCLSGQGCGGTRVWAGTLQGVRGVWGPRDADSLWGCGEVCEYEGSGEALGCIGTGFWAGTLWQLREDWGRSGGIDRDSWLVNKGGGV